MYNNKFILICYFWLCYVEMQVFDYEHWKNSVGSDLDAVVSIQNKSLNEKVC